MAKDLFDRIRIIELTVDPVIGLRGSSKDVFIAQVIESLRRVKYLSQIAERLIDQNVLNTSSKLFDPLKGSVLRNRCGDLDEAWWLIFLATHFGRNSIHKWSLSGAFYGRLNQGGVWDWESASSDPEGAVNWLNTYNPSIRALGISFGNHRKYQSLSALGPRGTGAAIRTYIGWAGSSHAQRFITSTAQAQTSTENFAALYESLGEVAEFGRTARFDFLSTLGKLGVADVQANDLYLKGATGPLSGAKLLLTGSKHDRISSREATIRIAPIRDALGVTYDVLEDALCNWQKSPRSFVPFRG